MRYCEDDMDSEQNMDEDEYEDIQDEDDDPFQADENIDLMDKNLHQFAKNEDQEPEEGSPYPNNDELLDDADQSSVEDIEPQEEQKVQVNSQGKIKVNLPEPPANFDKNKYADEFERYDPNNVAEAMFARKERKIPGSVLKPHSPYANLV